MLAGALSSLKPRLDVVARRHPDLHPAIQAGVGEYVHYIFNASLHFCCFFGPSSNYPIRKLNRPFR